MQERRKIMKRNGKVCSRVLKLLAACAMLVMLMGITSMAAETKVVDMPKNGQGIYFYEQVLDNFDTTVYHRIVVTKPGRLEVSGLSYGTYGSAYSMRVHLCDSKMQSMEGSTSGSYVNGGNSSAWYGIKKGTYYLKVSGERAYRLAAAFTPMADKGGASKKKAAAVKRKKAITGVMTATEKAKKADWFKFKIKKSKKLTINIAAYGNCAFRFYIYGPSYKKGLYMGYQQNSAQKYYSINGLSRKKAKIKAGTYYIKVVRSSYYPKSSGAYSIKWS